MKYKKKLEVSFTNDKVKKFKSKPWFPISKSFEKYVEKVSFDLFKGSVMFVENEEEIKKN